MRVQQTLLMGAAHCYRAGVFSRFLLRDFRGFASLDLANLQRVNLIVGRNNSGKTSLLEAIALLCDPKRISSDLPGLLRAHPGNISDRFLRWIVRDGSVAESLLLGEVAASKPPLRVFMTGKDRAFDQSTSTERQGAFFQDVNLKIAYGKDFSGASCRVVSVQQREPGALVQLFDRAMSRRGGEERIEMLLREADPRLRRIRIRAPRDEGPFIEVDLGLSERIPLSQVGQGMSRLVAILSELLGEATSVCLIDEIENGLHHSLLPQVWRGLAAAASELDVQIFATTHSHECILAAHEAFSQGAAYDLGIIQLFRLSTDSSSEVQGRVLDRKLIEAAVSGEIDLR